MVPIAVPSMSNEELRSIDTFIDDLDTLVITGLNAIEEEDLDNSILIRSLFDDSDEDSTAIETMTTESISEAFLGSGNKPRTDDRTDFEISENAKLYPKEGRAKLKTADLKSYLRMVERCQKGMTTKFALLEPLDQDAGLERLKKSYNVMTRRDELRKEIEDADMDDVFHIPLEYDENGIPTSKKSVYLLDTTHGVDLGQVIKASALYALKSPVEYHPQNISWSGEKILASCEDDLKEKIIQSAKSVPVAKRGGPVYLYLMNALIISTSEKAMRGLTEKISSLKLTSFNGENVLTAGSYLKGALNLLDAHERTPKDINLLIFRIFESGTTSEFTDYVKSVQSSLETSKLFGHDNKMTPEQIITAFENKYSDLLGQDQWVAKTTTDSPSAFSAETSTGKICFNCGALDHIVPECPKPRDENAIKQRRALFNKGNQNGRQGGRGRGRGGRGRGGRGGRGGRSGRGGRNNGQNGGTDSDNQSSTTDDVNLKKPPKAGESHKKTIAGKQLLWCGLCGKWGVHDTAQHPSDDKGDNEQAEGNYATVNSLSFAGAVCASLN